MIRSICLAAVALFSLYSFARAQQSPQGIVWPIRIEEPTGIERREGEVVRLESAFAAGQVRGADALRVLDERKREVPIQVAVKRIHPDKSLREVEILFPVSLIPGQLPAYTLVASPQFSKPRAPDERGGEYRTDLIVRRLGTSRVEIGNDRFGVIVNLGRDGTTPAVVEAYHRGAGPQRSVNLVETTPDLEEPLTFGVRSAGWGTATSTHPATQAARESAGFTSVEIIERGPLRARVRLSGAGPDAEAWEFEWCANSPVLVWRARAANKTGDYGFFFSAISATPYEPFTHWTEGVELGWPDGWVTDNPPHRKIAATDFDELPGGHVLYYNPTENYGALGLFELDRTLKWVGVGARQFYAAKKIGAVAGQKPQTDTGAMNRPDVSRAAAEWTTQIGLSFPAWRGTETLLQARADYRRFAQPLLSHTLAARPLADADAALAVSARAPLYRMVEETVKESRDRAAPASDVAEFSLDGSWKLQHAEKGEGERKEFFAAKLDDANWRTVAVPGSVHTQILKYPDYFSPQAEWISFKEWWYRKSFRLPDDLRGRKKVRLRFGATDYYADVWLNGRRLGRHEGYIDSYEFEVGDRLDPDGDNVLAVRVWTPVDYYWRHRPYTVKGSYGAVDQKPDNITPLGVTRPVSLVAEGPVRINDVSVDTALNPDGSAEVEAEVTFDAAEMSGEMELVLSPRNFSGEKQLRATLDLAQLDAGQSSVKVRFHLEKPELWWTWDHGRPNLYTLATSVRVGGRVADRREQAVGVREIEKIGWVFYLNGKRLYIRGTNSYYLELFMSEMNRRKYERDLKLMKDLNINMIRLHCHFQNPEFYELTDELGILVWQDYLEAWYPRDTEFALRASELYDPLIEMVRNHPSVAVWAVSDEEDLENYRVLTKHLAGRLFARDSQRRAVVRSTGRYGDGHIYHGWYEGTIWQYTKTEEKFISELGATALPDYESLVQFLPNHWPIEEHKMDWVFRKLQMTEAMRAWGRPEGKTLKEYIPQTQAYVARLHQLAIERMRRRKYDAGGILHFHAIDFWPSVTMAALDYFRRPTRSYHAVRRSFQMVLASFEYDRDKWKTGEEMSGALWLVNDHWFALPGATVHWTIVDAGGAKLAGGAQKNLNVAEDSAGKIGEIRWTPRAPGAIQLRTVVTDGAGKQLSENVYDFEVIN